MRLTIGYNYDRVRRARCRKFGNFVTTWSRSTGKAIQQIVAAQNSTTTPSVIFTSNVGSDCDAILKTFAKRWREVKAASELDEIESDVQRYPVYKCVA